MSSFRGVIAAASLVAALLAVAGCGGGSAAPTTAPVTAAPAAVSAGKAVRLPPVGGRFDYQIGGAYAPAAGVTIVDRDHSDPPAPGVYDICYVNAFQTQPEQAAFWNGKHPDLVLHRGGKPVGDPDWPGEMLLDTSTAAKRTAIARIVDGWIDGCATAGYQAVEPDNLDSWTRSHGLLDEADNLAMAGLLASDAHAHGLAIAQKNTDQLGAAGHTVAHLDFAVAEECQVYAECGQYTAVYGRHVIEIEYTDNGLAAFQQSCAARGRRISVELRDRDVVARGQSGYVARWC